MGRHPASLRSLPPRGRNDDALALPTVPPAAPADHPRRDALVTLAFVLAIFVALAGAINHRTIKLTRFENRATEPWPAWPPAASLRSQWTKRFESAFADRFGGRDRLIATHHRVLALGLRTSPVGKVLLGRDSWLYFRGEDERAIDRDYRGVVAYPPEQPAEIARELAHRHALLAARGIPYVVLIVPDKATIYPEHLPGWIVRAPKTRLDRLFEALAAHPEVAVIDPRAALFAAKAGRQVYYRTDSHWNYAGAVVAYDLTMARVREAVPAVPHVPAEWPRYEPGDTYSGDLAQLLGLPQAFAEEDWFPLGKVFADASRRCARPIADPVEPVVQGCARPGLPRALVYRDSMFDALVPLVSENFSRVVYFAGHRMSMADVAREHPDVVIEEFVERTMHALLVDPAQ